MRPVMTIIVSIFLGFSLVACSRPLAAPENSTTSQNSATSQDSAALQDNFASPGDAPSKSPGPSGQEPSAAGTQESLPAPDNPGDPEKNYVLTLEASEELVGSSALQRLYDHGLKLYYDRKFNEALDLFNQVLTIEPDNYLALNGKGATYAFEGRYNEGVALIQQAIQIKPDFVYARFNLGLAYELAGNYEESILSYKEALKLDDKDVWSYYGIASIYGRKGDVEQVVEWLRPAIALDPEVKVVAHEEKDFNPVRNDPRFEALIQE